MFYNPMINNVVEWERRLEIENEQGSNRRGMPDFFPQSQPEPRQRKSLLDRLFGPVKIEQPDYSCCAQENHQRA